MKILSRGCAVVMAGALAGPVQAFTFTLTPVTNTTPNFAGAILIQGTVTVAADETFLSPTVMSTVDLPFNSTFTAGFNGSGQVFDAAFLAWNGVGTYTGPIYDNQISANNLGYSGGMPLGLYGSNAIGPGGQSAIILSYTDIDGRTRSATAVYAISVVPAPGTLGALACGAIVLRRRRR